MTTLLIQQVLIMFLLSGVGYVCFKTGKISMEGSKTLGNVLIYLSLPCVIINSFLVERTPEKLTGLLISSGAALITLLISILVSRIFFSKDAILCFASTFSNPGFFGIPLILASLADGAVFYIAAFIAFINLGQWTYGVALLTADHKAGKSNDTTAAAKAFFKKLFTAPFMVGILIGLFFFLTGLPMPSLIGKSITYIAGLNTPIAMFTIGIYLAQTNLGEIFRTPKLYLLSAVRLILIPLVSLAVLALLPASMSDLKMALLIVTACPVGSNVAVYAQLHNHDYPYAVKTVVISTLLSIITIPLIVEIAGMLHFY